jgi:hypothetical protein
MHVLVRINATDYVLDVIRFGHAVGVLRSNPKCARASRVSGQDSDGRCLHELLSGHAARLTLTRCRRANKPTDQAKDTFGRQKHGSDLRVATPQTLSLSKAKEVAWHPEACPKQPLFDAGDTVVHWNVHKLERFVWLCEQAGVCLPQAKSARMSAAGAADRFFYAHLLAGGREHADLVRNLQANPQVTVELGDESHVSMARLLEAGAAEDQLARELLLAKYSGSEDDLDEWARTSLAVVVAFPAEAS